MYLGEMIDLIRVEANIMGRREFTVQLNHIVNQEANRIVGMAKYPALYKNSTFTTTTTEQNSFSLPVDFQQFGPLIWSPIELQDFQQPWDLSPGLLSQYLQWINGNPKYYARKGSNFVIYPWSEVAIGDSLDFSYYAKIFLSHDEDVFPVDELTGVVIKHAAARMMFSSNTQAAQILKADADAELKAIRAAQAGGS